MVEEPISDEERLVIAKKFVKDMKFTIPSVVDSIGDETGTAYAAHPDRLYLVGKDGNIAWAGDRGPMGFKPDQLVAAIKKEVGKSGQDETDSKETEKSSGAPERSGRQAGGRSRFMSMPFMTALDADKDGKLSESEIENASAALKSLDKDESGTVTLEELVPQRGGGGQRGGRGR